MFQGADFLQIGIKHATLGTLTLYPKSGENGQIDYGGLETESDQKSITGSGEAIYKTSVKRWAVETPPIAWRKSSTDTLQSIKNMANSYLECDFTFELADGTIWVGTGRIVGELKGATLDSTFPLKIEGGGKLAMV
ncbi:MAG: hypothetical protein H6Q17_559 [Bacteroidetes bacterium]|nr:hypothetical protein [Bacteroidota bacterium]